MEEGDVGARKQDVLGGAKRKVKKGRTLEMQRKRQDLNSDWT